MKLVKYADCEYDRSNHRKCLRFPKKNCVCPFAVLFKFPGQINQLCDVDGKIDGCDDSDRQAPEFSVPSSRCT